MTDLSRRNFTLGMGAVGVAACSAPAHPLKLTASRPNVLVFIADDAGAREFGIYGNIGISTPNIDRLGRAGLIADAAILTTPQCSPSRISILSGLHPHATGAEDLHMPAPQDLQMLQSLLSQAGYFTGAMQKLHLGPDSEQQFDWYEDSLTALPQFIEQSGDRPFFMWVGFRDPHRKYDRDSTPQTNPMENVEVPHWLIDDEATRRDLADYYNEISRMDGNIGRMMRELEVAGQLNNTLVIFISDNGAPMPRAKGTLYDSGIKTPFVAHWPGVIPAGLRHDKLLSVIDLAPTIMALAGLDVPRVMQGESMVQGLRDPAALTRKYAFSSRNWHNTDEHQRSVRTEQFKLITNAYTHLNAGVAADISAGGAWKSLLRAHQEGRTTDIQAQPFIKPRPSVELYDLQNDPDELVNLATDEAYKPVREALRSTLEQWRHRTGDHDVLDRRRADNVSRETGLKPKGAARLPEWLPGN